MITDFKLFEKEISLSQYMDFINDVGMFLTLNTSHLSQYALDKNAITVIQQQFRKPVINGLTYTQLINDPLVKNLKAIPYILNWIKLLFEYVEPRFENYLNDEGKTKFIGRLNVLKKKYTQLVK
jgi:hypothetical protein